MDHLVDGAVRPAADLPQVPEVLRREVAVLLPRDLQLARRLDAVCPQALSAAGENGSRRRRSVCVGREGGIEWQTLAELPA